MNRRQFIGYSMAWSASLAVGTHILSCAEAPVRPVLRNDLLKGLGIMDAHAHPDQFHSSRRSPRDETSTLEAIKGLGMAASSFAAVGDSSRPYGNPLTFYQSARFQLQTALDLAQSGKVKLVLKAADVPEAAEGGFVPGAILSIEGGDPLGGNPDRVDEFHKMGVRIITPVHYRNNELGDIMAHYRSSAPCPAREGLTSAGRKVVERMQRIGIVVDVAHAHPLTLQHIAEMSSRPLLDSHTSPCVRDDLSRCQRTRPWNDMELVARTGGVVCTWPALRRGGPSPRRTFLDWAGEIAEMKRRLGMEHVGLGTDGGGGVTCVEGYHDVRDLVHLVAAMQEVGLSREDIKAFMGGNFYRVLRECIG